MRFKKFSLFITILIFSFLLVLNINKVIADPTNDTACSILGCNTIAPKVNIGDKTTDTTDLIKYGVGLVFVGLIVFGIFLTIKAAFTIINSNGNPGKIEEGANAVKAAFIGIIVVVVGIVGIFVLLSFFRATGLAGQDVNVPSGINVPLISK